MAAASKEDDMEFRYLGTGAAEGIPAAFCNCPLCREAQKLGGKDIRTRSQAMINGDLLIDFPPDSYMHKLRYGLDLSAFRYLLVTHKHMDHFFPQEFGCRGGYFSHGMVHEDLEIFCAEETKEYFDRACGSDMDGERRSRLLWHILRPFETVAAGTYRITPLPASHMHEGNEPLMFHIRDEEGKSVLYLHDSGYYGDGVWEYFRQTASAEGPVSLVSIDATDGKTETCRSGHMGFSEALLAKERMESLGIAGPRTICVFNHFSHNGRYLHEELVRAAQPHRVVIAYDGMTQVL